jgi:2-polyprenyl-3-methyl-5-hydroxy-6-metoxy-1,4-benzoquinol methylase
MFRETRIVSDSPNIETIIDFGNQPLADTFVSRERLGEPDATYPLRCDLCGECGQIQAKCITDPAKRYSDHQYSYTSSNSGFSRQHWTEYALDVAEHVALRKGEFVVEIGSNDGFLAEQFMKSGNKVVGVDASPHMATLAEARRVETVVGLFDRAVARTIRSSHGPATVIVANNVYNHADDPVEFARAAAELLDVDGTLVVESPYWRVGLQQATFHQVYHEHVSYFTARSLTKMMALAGLVISAVQCVDYHGGSIRIYASRKGVVGAIREDVQIMIRGEGALGLFDLQTYEAFMKSILDRRHRFLQDVYRLKSAGASNVAVGAAAKGNTFLSVYRLDHSVIDYVTDASPEEHGKYTPVTRIPICDDSVFAEYGEVYALILAWNISTTLRRKLLEINPAIRFLVP